MCQYNPLLTLIVSFKPEKPFVNIGDEKGGELNGFQRLLVHQLVKNEFPGYRSFARNRQSFVQVEKVEPKKEAEVRETPISQIFVMQRYMLSQEEPVLAFMSLTINNSQDKARKLNEFNSALAKQIGM